MINKSPMYWWQFVFLPFHSTKGIGKCCALRPRRPEFADLLHGYALRGTWSITLEGWCLEMLNKSACMYDHLCFCPFSQLQGIGKCCTSRPRRPKFADISPGHALRGTWNDTLEGWWLEMLNKSACMYDNLSFCPFSQLQGIGKCCDSRPRLLVLGLV
jgi:hypothetical protein